MGDVLVLAEYQHGHFPKTTLVAVSAGLELARKRNGKCIGVVVGDQADALAGELAKYGLSKVVALENPALAHYLADAHAQALAALVKKLGVEYVLATATALGKDLMPRLAARLDAPMASDIVAIGDDGTVVRPMYAGNVLATVELNGPVKVVSVRATAFDSAKPAGTPAPVEKVAAETRRGRVQDAVRLLQRDQERPPATHRGANRGIRRTRAQVGRELQDCARAAGR